MERHVLSPVAGRSARSGVGAAAASAAVASAVVLAVAGPAWAHTAIDVDNPQAGARNVTMTVTAEAESNSAGIVSVRVQLPPGMPAQWVSLISGPAGWALSPAADGYTVAGPALPVRQDARYVLRLAQLPDTAAVLTFKTLVTYSDGHVDRWIEEPTAANPSPDHPAPTVSLRPGPAVPASSTAASAGPVVSPTPAAAGTRPASGRSGAGPVGWWIAAALLLVAAVTIVLLLLRRGRAGPGGRAD
jgi:hypothetical protein